MLLLLFFRLFSLPKFGIRPFKALELPLGNFETLKVIAMYFTFLETSNNFGCLRLYTWALLLFWTKMTQRRLRHSLSNM